jgi:quercetin dioxygenase-like cupin family protein
MLQPEEVGCEIRHHWLSKGYLKDTLIREGVELTQHSHTFDHVSVLLSGSVIVKVRGEVHRYTAPAGILIAANHVHSVLALEESVWLCIHETTERDVTKIDASLINHGADSTVDA